MYLTTGDILAVTIALITSMALLFIVTFANIHLLNENRFLMAGMAHQNLGKYAKNFFENIYNLYIK